MGEEKSDLGEMSAPELAQLFSTRQASPVEATQAFLARIERYNPIFNAFAYVCHDLALKAARESEARWQRGEPLSVMDGLPITIKELTPVAGIPWRRGSRLGSDVPEEKEYLFLERVRASGLVILGTTAAPELGWKGVTTGPAFGSTANPWDTDRTCGGSSGGAAVSAVMNLGVLHDGSDGGGSLRIPGSFCGAVGFKSTQGLVPADTMGNSMELGHRGPMGRTVHEIGLYLKMASGYSPLGRQGYCPPDTPDWMSIVAPENLRGVRIGYSPALGYEKVNPEVATRIDLVAERLAAAGAVVEKCDPGFSSPAEAFRKLWFTRLARAIDTMGLTSGQFQLLDPGLLAQVEKYRQTTVYDYIGAQRIQSDVKVAMATYHERHDIMMLPTMPITAFEKGEDVPPGSGMETWVEWSPFTFPFNLTGQPAVSVPCGFDSQGLPIGVQFVGPLYSDARVLALAAFYQANFPEKTCPEL